MQEASNPGARLERSKVAAAIAFSAAAAIILITGGIDFAFSLEAPARTDLGGHIVALRHLLNVSLPAGRLVDWSNHWFGGYPSFHFYFPLPAIAIAAIAQIAPLEVAAKTVAVLTPLLLLLSMARLTRSLGFGAVHVIVVQLGCVVFLTDTANLMYGGNVLSNVLGEYSYGMGLGFGILYLSFVADHVRHGSGSLLAMTAALAATALCHSIPTIMAVTASSVALFRPGARARVLISWTLGFTLTAFWGFPFLIRSSYMGHSIWPYAPGLGQVFSPALLLLLPWTLYAMQRDRTVAATGNGLIPAVGVSGLMLYLVPHGFFLQERGLPFWYLSVFTLTALGLASALEGRLRGGRPLERTFLIAGVTVLIATVVIQGALVRGRSHMLLSADAPDRGAYDALLAALRELPPGRLHWEDRPAKPTLLLGNVIAMLRIPDLVPGVTTTLGLLVESTHMLRPLAFVGRDISWDPAVVVADPARAGPMAPDPRPEARIARLAELGVNYLVTLSEAGHRFAGREAGLPLLRHHADWRIWQIPAAPLVEPLAMPVVAIGRAQYHEAITEWIYRGALTKQRVAVMERELEAPESGGGVGAVSRRARTVGFQTSAVGVPHLVRVPYFPNWRARGAEGPWLVAPGFMLVVPQQPAVELRFADTWVEHTGRALSLLTLLALPFLLLAARRAERGRSDVQAVPGTAADRPTA